MGRDVQWTQELEGFVLFFLDYLDLDALEIQLDVFGIVDHLLLKEGLNIRQDVF